MKRKEFIPPIHGVTFYDNDIDVSEIQEKAKKFCKWTGKGFPGCQPVSMTLENISLLQDKPYRVSWKADGVRLVIYLIYKLLSDKLTIFKTFIYTCPNARICNFRTFLSLYLLNL